jgi:restriction system protein
MTDWHDYQEEVAEFFRSVGLDATTNEAVKGVRTSHDVDVVVRSNHVGFDLLWLVECKHWSDRVSKLHVLGLRQIVSDTGADRGFMMAEKGYQRGAFEAAQLTNVQLTSLTELKSTAGHALGMVQLQLLQERVDSCGTRYWNLSKDVRIAQGLRDDVGGTGYSGYRVLKAAQAALNSAFRGRFPIARDDATNELDISLVDPDLFSINTPYGLFQRLESLINDLEARLDAAYAATGQG